MKILTYILLFFWFNLIIAQEKEEKEIIPPFNIKTICFIQNNQVVLPFFKLGESFELHFDDLYANEADYYYTITQYTHDWKPTDLSKVEYLEGLDNQRIITYQNSFNTLQLYSHYNQQFPNKFNRITKSGNYILKIFNEDQEIVFSKKIIVYEDLIKVGAIVRKSRDLETIQQKQNLDFTINLGQNTLQNPKQNIKVSIFQNGRWDTSKHEIIPQFTIGNELVYRYNEETQFWAGNEFLNYDNSIIRAPNNTVMKYTSGDIYNTFLFPNFERKNNRYTFFPDINGLFFTSNRSAENSTIEADYTWVHFSLNASTTFTENKIYINGMFNNYTKNDEYLMEYNSEKGVYEKAILVKQGFVNYTYSIVDKKNKIDQENAIEGNFFQTENQYNIIIYYRGNNDRYDRVIGNGITNSTTMQN